MSDSRLFTRRTLMMLGAALTPTLARVQTPSSTAPLSATALADAWRSGFAGPLGRAIAWWYAGTLYAHVDGLREFPVLTLNTIMTGRTSVSAGATVLDWHTVGYFSDLDSGEPASHWDNIFTGRRQPVPSRFIEGPGQYRLSATGAELSLTAANVRTNRSTLTGSMTADGLMLTQIEGTLQGLPRLDGALPPLDSPDITERQSRLQLVIARDTSSQSMPSSAARGFFNQVYDALPPWLGFGDRLGSALSKGVARRARAGEVVNPAVWSALRRLHGTAFMDDHRPPLR